MYKIFAPLFLKVEKVDKKMKYKYNYLLNT